MSSAMMTRMLRFCGCWADARSAEIDPIAVKVVRTTSPEWIFFLNVINYWPFNASEPMAFPVRTILDYAKGSARKLFASVTTAKSRGRFGLPRAIFRPPAVMARRPVAQRSVAFPPRFLNLLQDSIEVIGLWCLQWREWLVGHQFLLPEQLSDR